MMTLQKLGGIAAIYEAAAYVMGIVGFLLVVGWPEDPVEQVHVILQHQSDLHILHLLVYVAWGIFMVILALALQERLKEGAPTLALLSAVFGVIWATIIIASGMIFISGANSVVNIFGSDPSQAITLWLAIDAVFNGLGGGNEVIGGIWILLISWAALKFKQLPKKLNFLGIAIGVAGVASIAPPLAEITIMIFALGQIAWFLWLGIFMLRS